MSIYQEINIIDDFEERFGNCKSIKRACECLVSYISGLQRPLPEIAAQGLRVAVKYKEGSALPGELEIARKQIVDFLKARHAMYKEQAYPMEHAVWGILQVYRDLCYDVESGAASEFVSSTLGCIENFDSNYELLRALLKETFVYRA